MLLERERDEVGWVLLRFLFSVMAFVAGVCVLQQMPVLPRVWPFLLLSLIGGWMVWRCRVAQWFGLALALFCLGFAYANLRASGRIADRLSPSLEGQTMSIEGYVAGLPQATRFGARFLFVPTQSSSAPALLPRRIQMSWYGDKDRVQAGERWRLQIKLKRVHGQVNPGGFDLESWFLQQNIGATATVQRGEKLVGFASAAWLSRLRAALRERVHKALADAPYTGVIVALSIGEQSGISPTQWQRFAATGITHLISISGLHITLLAGLCAGLTQFIWRRIPYLAARIGAPRAALWGGVLAALIYSALAGMAVPTQRTLLMLVVAALGIWRARGMAISAIWASALLVVVLVDPFSVLSVGFWLSFMTVGVLLWVGSNRIGDAPKWQSWLRAQGAATLGSAPILLVVFGQLPLLSPLANGFAIPIVSMLVTPLALAGLLDPTGYLLRAAERLFAGTDYLLSLCAALPLNQWNFSMPPAWTLLPAAVGVALCLAPRGIAMRLLGVVFLLPLAVIRPPPLAENAFRASVLDVGQGLSVLVETRSRSLVFDVGQVPNGERTLLPALRAAGLGRIDTLVLSHNDSDHVGSAAAVLAAWPVGQVRHSLPDDLPWLQLAPQRQPCMAGDSWQQDGVRFAFLWPPAGFSSKSDNARSCVLLIDNGQHRMLIPADLGGPEEAQLVATALPQIDIVVAGHHGGKGSSSAEMIAAIQPKYAVFSVGYRNQFKHPRSDTLARYSAAGTEILRTDHNGALIFEVGKQISVRRWRDETLRYWYTLPDTETAH